MFAMHAGGSNLSQITRSGDGGDSSSIINRILPDCYLYISH